MSGLLAHAFEHQGGRTGHGRRSLGGCWTSQFLTHLFRVLELSLEYPHLLLMMSFSFLKWHPGSTSTRNVFDPLSWSPFGTSKWAPTAGCFIVSLALPPSSLFSIMLLSSTQMTASLLWMDCPHQNTSYDSNVIRADHKDGNLREVTLLSWICSCLGTTYC